MTLGRGHGKPAGPNRTSGLFLDWRAGCLSPFDPGAVVDALGVNIADNTSRPGALVVAVQPTSPAAKAGLAAGDTIVKVNDTTITGASDLATALAGLKPGENVTLSVVGTDGSTRTVTTTLEQLPGS